MIRSLRILLLEDNEHDARLIVHELRRACPESIVKRVETESEFLALLDPAPELILADYQLPQFDALGALRLVHDRGLDVPVIVITGVLGDEAAVQCLKQGAADYLLKDRLARLGPAIANALEQSQVRAEQRRAGQALRDSEARKTAILETTMDGIITVDDQGIIESLNPAAERLFGYPAAEIIGQDIGKLIPPIPATEHDSHIDRNLSSGGGKITGTRSEVVGRKRDGAIFPLEMSVSEVRLDARRLYTRIVRDITERKQAEFELVRRASELARSNAELEQFAYIASHDLQEPLRTIGNFTQLLARRYAGKLDPAADEFIAFIVDGVSRMQALINDLLAYSRVASGREALQPTDCEAVVERTLVSLKKSIDENGAVITRERLPSVRADGVQMGQLFQNLIGNALKYHGEAPPRIHIAAERQGKEWLFSVRDNGIGFDPKHRERIFVILQRLHTPDKYPGTGIGLAVCKKIVERHAGRIWAESEPGRARAFCLRFRRWKVMSHE